MEGVHIVGEKLGWVPNYNYSDWTNTTHIYPGDWLGNLHLVSFYSLRLFAVLYLIVVPLLFFLAFVRLGFRFDKNMFDVAMVNKTAYETCDSSHLLWQYNKSVAYLQLNHTGRYYFICTRGSCFNQMKVAILVEKRPSPTQSPTGKNIKNGASPLETLNFKLLRVALAVAAVFSMIVRL
ncbi:early nodulin-like protein 17 [Aristolochia californica]|uniref:early nodulin-like protein 17 n=1 Tax=Aristolochia californica TaxID=171875 RepID=UPI0035D62A32